MFDEKIDSLNQLEIQLKAKIVSMQEKVDLLNDQIKE